MRHKDKTERMLTFLIETIIIGLLEKRKQQFGQDMPNFVQTSGICIFLKGGLPVAKAEYRSAVRSRRLIKAALADLLQEKPLDKITVTDVVNRAEINRGTFYAHYADIPDVIHQMVEEAFCRIRDVLSDQTYPIEALPGVLLGRIQSILDEDQAFYRRILASHAAKQLSDQLCAVVVDYLLEHESEFAVGSHEDFELPIRFCAGGLSQLYQDWFAGNLHCTQETFNQKAELLLTRAIGL